MGLIQLAKDVGGSFIGAVQGTASSMLWKEYFVSGDMSNGILMKRAEKVLVEDGKNKRSDDNLISSGSGIDVQDGQCMIIVDNGRVVDFCVEPGRYTYDDSTQPSLLSGNNKGLKAVAQEIKTQWLAGGQRFSTQRIYFINTGEITTPIKWGIGNCGFTHGFQVTPQTPPMRVNVMLKAHGMISVHIDDPVRFYKTIGAQKAGGDNAATITLSSFEENVWATLKAALGSAVSTALARISMDNMVAYTHITAYSGEISEEVAKNLSTHRLVQCGFGFYDFKIEGTPELTEADYKKISDMEKSFNMSNNAGAANYDVQMTIARGFENAGNNGGVTGIMGMGMAMGGGLGSLGNMQQTQQPMQQPYMQQPQQQMYQQPTQQPVQQAVVAQPATDDSWTCSCGTTNAGNFCVGCGSKRPAPVQQNEGSWTCSCGAVNTGNFCSNCGNKKVVKRTLRCDKCGWVAPEGTVTKFCPDCGDPVTADDFR